MQNKYPGFTEKYLKFYLNFKEKLEKKEKFNRATYFTSQALGFLFHYLDVYKDVNLFIIIYNLNGGWESIAKYPAHFTSIISLSPG